MKLLLIIIDCAIGCVGIPANVMLILAIAFSKDSNMKVRHIRIILSWSISAGVFTNSAEFRVNRLSQYNTWIDGNDKVFSPLVLVLLKFKLLLTLRMISIYPYLLHVFEGFCTHISKTSCEISMQLELHLMYHSIMLIAVAFWYRFACLGKGTSIGNIRNAVLSQHVPSWIATQLTIIVILLPTLLSAVRCRSRRKKIQVSFFQFIFTWSEDSFRLLPIVYPGINLTSIAHCRMKYLRNSSEHK